MGAFLGPVKFCEVPFASSPAVGCGGGGKWTCGVYWLRSRELTRAPVGKGQTYSHLFYLFGYHAIKMVSCLLLLYARG